VVESIKVREIFDVIADNLLHLTTPSLTYVICFLCAVILAKLNVVEVVPFF
jgi:hypothetical protein